MPFEQGGDAPTEVRAGEESAVSSARFEAGAMVGERYRIVAELGRGGMGHVFRAEDTRLGQPVALKFLPPRTAGNAEMLDRLVAEVRIGRGVSHPNVCRTYDIVDTSDGLHFITMEFVDGEDLASLLRRIGRFTLERGIAVARDICAGLGSAHDQAVVHRDLKPANVMIDGRGRARITDFGLATIQGDPRSREVAGTVGYMAPEQLRGERLDARTDVYALGLVLFEMFTGRRMYDANTMAEVLEQHGRSKVLPSSIAAELPPEIDSAILACLEESPDSRPRSARAVAAMLPSPDDAAATSGRTSSSHTPRRSDRADRSVAVLPFEDLGGTGDDAFVLGLADEIISDLAAIRELRVISRASVMRFRGRDDLTAVGRDLQVATVLNGSIRKVGDQLRLNANLVDARSAEIIWSEKFRGSMADIFDIQETVARAVATQLRAHVSAEESARIARRPITDPVAWELTLRARTEMWSATAEKLRSAEELLDRAESIAGENPAILDVRASVEWHFYNSRVDHTESRLARADALAARIAAFDPASASVARIRGLVAISRGEAKSGRLHLREAVERDPNEVEAAFWLLMLLAAAGRNDLAQPIAEHLRQRDPFSLGGLTGRAYFAIFRNDIEEALQLLDLGDSLHPNAAPARFVKGAALAHAGRRAEALSVWSELAAGASYNIFRQIAEFSVACLRGDRERAMKIYRETLEHDARDSIVHGVELALAFAALGETALAADWLENAIRRGFFAADRIAKSALAVPILGDPRIQALLERMRVESAAVSAR